MVLSWLKWNPPRNMRKLNEWHDRTIGCVRWRLGVGGPSLFPIFWHHQSRWGGHSTINMRRTAWILLFSPSYPSKESIGIALGFSCSCRQWLPLTHTHAQKKKKKSAQLHGLDIMTVRKTREIQTVSTCDLVRVIVSILSKYHNALDP